MSYPQKPYLKYPGNKLKVLPHILPKLPPGRRLVEPFAGSCAVALNIYYPEYLLADRNQALVAMHNHFAADKYADLFCEASRLFAPLYNTGEMFYTVRKLFNETPLTNPMSAVYLLWLNRHCYNGLFRFNKAGGFNAPYGRYKKVYFPAEELATFRMQPFRLYLQDFRRTFEQVRPGDVVYCDPPYAVASGQKAGYTSYDGGVFTERDQTDLVRHAISAVEKHGVTVLISNHDTLHTQLWYNEATEVHTYPVGRSISCKGDGRKPAQELLAIYR